MRLEPFISHTGILMTFYLSIILDLQNFFHYFEPYFLWLKALWIVSFKRVFNLSCGRVVYRVERSKVLIRSSALPMGTDCAPLLTDLFIYSYESEFLQKLVKDKKIHEARAFNDVSGNQNNCYWPLHSESIARCKHHMQEKLVYCCTYLENWVDHCRQIRGISPKMMWTKLYMCSGGYINGRNSASDFLKRHLYRRNRLLDQGYEKIRLIRSLKKFIFRYQDLVEIYSVKAVPNSVK
jgi:hypothetical protein